MKPAVVDYILDYFHCNPSGNVHEMKQEQVGFFHHEGYVAKVFITISLPICHPLQVLVAEYCGDISFVGRCSIRHCYKYVGFIKHAVMTDIVKTSLLEG
jgi:hypothetical protein